MKDNAITLYLVNLYKLYKCLILRCESNNLPLRYESNNFPSGKMKFSKVAIWKDLAPSADAVVSTQNAF